jgi:hypothetical protein
MQSHLTVKQVQTIFNIALFYVLANQEQTSTNQPTPTVVQDDSSMHDDRLEYEDNATQPPDDLMSEDNIGSPLPDVNQTHGNNGDENYSHMSHDDSDNDQSSSMDSMTDDETDFDLYSTLYRAVLQEMPTEVRADTINMEYICQQVERKNNISLAGKMTTFNEIVKHIIRDRTSEINTRTTRPRKLRNITLPSYVGQDEFFLEGDEEFELSDNENEESDAEDSGYEEYQTRAKKHSVICQLCNNECAVYQGEVRNNDELEILKQRIEVRLHELEYNPNSMMYKKHKNALLGTSSDFIFPVKLGSCCNQRYKWVRKDLQ